jgi:hypothetical protein
LRAVVQAAPMRTLLVIAVVIAVVHNNPPIGYPFPLGHRTIYTTNRVHGQYSMHSACAGIVVGEEMEHS